MIDGIVRNRAPVIRLEVRGLRGRREEVEAVVDTGYTGWLSLPQSIESMEDMAGRCAPIWRGMRKDATRACRTRHTPSS